MYRKSGLRDERRAEKEADVAKRLGEIAEYYTPTPEERVLIAAGWPQVPLLGGAPRQVGRGRPWVEPLPKELGPGPAGPMEIARINGKTIEAEYEEVGVANTTGQVVISGRFPLEVRSEFRKIQADCPEKSMQDLLIEAVSDLVAKYRTQREGK
jgi:hypothetical protein